MTGRFDPSPASPARDARAARRARFAMSVGLADIVTQLEQIRAAAEVAAASLIRFLDASDDLPDEAGPQAAEEGV
jgi:hypothetical protein